MHDRNINIKIINNININKEFIIPLSIYYYDTDLGGVLHHASFLRWMEKARSDFLEHNGVDLFELQQLGYCFVVRHIDINYLRPIFYYLKAEIVSQIIEIKRVSLIFKHIFRNRLSPQEIYCTSQIKLVLINQRQRPCKIPEMLIKKLIK